MWKKNDNTSLVSEVCYLKYRITRCTIDDFAMFIIEIVFFLNFIVNCAESRRKAEIHGVKCQLKHGFLLSYSISNIQ